MTAQSPLSIEEIARGMLQRYRTPQIALEMAMEHRHDYKVGTAQYQHWGAVAAAIERLSSSPKTR